MHMIHKGVKNQRFKFPKFERGGRIKLEKGRKREHSSPLGSGSDEIAEEDSTTTSSIKSPAPLPGHLAGFRILCPAALTSQPSKPGLPQS
ncbi:hypothetical protein BHM03_00052686 [Ensete ventricosum]|nr:hypothetical protein BHM03_00052686 [Ensete ventricosum]